MAAFCDGVHACTITNVTSRKCLPDNHERDKLQNMKALTKAIDKAGSQAELARLIGAAGQSTVGNWLHRGGIVPVEYCARVEKATGVTRKELRPDDYWLIWPDLKAPNHVQEKPRNA